MVPGVPAFSVSGSRGTEVRVVLKPVSVPRKHVAQAQTGSSRAWGLG